MPEGVTETVSGTAEAARVAAEPAARGAAFFDLDKTLMQGSSGFQFARAVREAGMMSRRQLVSDGIANVRFRLHGASDEQSEAMRNRIATSLEGVRVRDLERLGVRVMQRILPRLYPQMLTIAYAHQDAGRPVYIVTAAAQDMAQVLAKVMTFDGALGSTLSGVEDGVYTGQPTGAFLYGAAKAVAIQELAAARGLRPDGLLRLLRLRLRHADAAGGRPPGRRQPRHRARGARARRRLGDTATRSARSEADDRRPADRRRDCQRSHSGDTQAHGPPDRTATPEPPIMSTTTERKIRVVVAKPGLDGHDRGAKIIARALRDAGMEVIYTGLHQTPEQIVETVIQEDADAVGLSILSGAHMTLVPRIIELLKAQGVDDVVVTVGGTIPAEDIAELKALGVAEVFTPGAPAQAAIDFIRSAVRS